MFYAECACRKIPLYRIVDHELKLILIALTILLAVAWIGWFLRGVAPDQTAAVQATIDNAADVVARPQPWTIVQDQFGRFNYISWHGEPSDELYLTRESAVRGMEKTRAWHWDYEHGGRERMEAARREEEAAKKAEQARHVWKEAPPTVDT